MKHFIVYMIVIFGGLFAALFLKNRNQVQDDSRPVIKVYGNSSFIAAWGPGPRLKEIFERTCDCRVELLDRSDSSLMIQKLKSQISTGPIDVVFGFDQYDLEQVTSAVEWRRINLDNVNFVPDVRMVLSRSSLLPYDWSYLSFVVRKGDLKTIPTSIDEFLDSEWKNQISMEDPRTSSVGLQFLMWLIQVKGEESAFEFLKSFNAQVKTYAPKWSEAHGLFHDNQVRSFFTHVTSPVFYLLEEKDSNVMALPLNEGHPMQIEFVGVPNLCKECDLAVKFVKFLYTKEAQTIIMEKNYMFPVVAGVREGTAFANLPLYKSVQSVVIPSSSERERILKRWTALRRGE